MALFLTKNLYFRTKNSFMTPFLLSSYFHTHPIITLLLEILGGGCIGHHPLLKFLKGTVPQSPLSLRPCIPPSSSKTVRILRMGTFRSIAQIRDSFVEVDLSKFLKCLNMFYP